MGNVKFSEGFKGDESRFKKKISNKIVCSIWKNFPIKIKINYKLYWLTYFLFTVEFVPLRVFVPSISVDAVGATWEFVEGSDNSWQDKKRRIFD